MVRKSIYNKQFGRQTLRTTKNFRTIYITLYYTTIFTDVIGWYVDITHQSTHTFMILQLQKY